MIIQQISVFLENRAGQLSEITKLISDNGIDLQAINIAETADYGVLRLIADDPDKASEILRDNGFVFSITPVVAVSVPNVPGGLSTLLGVLADEDINIEYMCSAFGQKDGLAYMIFKVDDNEKLISVLERNSVEAQSIDDLGNK